MKWRSTNVLDAVRTALDRLPDSPLDRTAGPFRLTGHQRSGVAFARSALSTRGVVVIADDVGTGKSIIALRLIDEALAAGGAVLLTTPASLRMMWRGLLDWRHVPWVSHTRLSRGVDRPTGRPQPHDQATRIACLAGELMVLPADTLVIVDEAHAFRNAATRRHRTLARLCARARVVLLTATPVNNSLLDLYFLLRLRVPEGAFADLGVPDLGRAFRVAAATRRIDGPLARVLDQVVLRRPRASTDGVFPDRRLIPVRYDSGPAFDHALEILAGHRLAAYDPIGRSGTGDLVRLVLLKRLESSRAAFIASLERVLAFLCRFLDGLAAGRLITARAAPDDPAQLEFLCVTGEPLPPDLDISALRAEATADRAALERIRRMLPAEDGKMERLVRLIEELAGRRILVFTEFRESARALAHALRAVPRVGRIEGGGAWLGRSPVGRAEVVQRFAPHANGARPPPASEDVRILIATDVLSEGLNLQDADTVVNFDLPWNPVRLIQRMGRVDRLNSTHAVIRIYDFMPDRHLDRWIALVETLTRKVEAMGVALGRVRPVLPGPGPRQDGATREPPAPDPRAILRALVETLETTETLTTNDRAGFDGRGTVPASLHSLTPSPDRESPGDSIPLATLGPELPADAVLFLLAEPEPGFRLVRPGGVHVPPPADVVHWLRSGMPLQLDGDPPAEMLDGAARRLRMSRSAITGGSVAAGAVRRVLELAGRGDTPVAERLVARLAHLAPGEEQVAIDWLERKGTPEALEDALGPATEPRVRILAAFVSSRRE